MEQLKIKSGENYKHTIDKDQAINNKYVCIAEMFGSDKITSEFEEKL